MRRLLSLGLIIASLGSLALGQNQDEEAQDEGARAEEAQTEEAQTEEARADRPSPPATATPPKEVPARTQSPGAAPADPPGATPRGERAMQIPPPATSIQTPEAKTRAQEAETRGPIPPSPPNASAPMHTPGQLLRSLLTTSPETQLPGTARTLAEVLRIASPGPRWRYEQTARIGAYWDLSAALADDVLAQREQLELKALHAGIVTPGPAWQQALSAAQARVHLARRAAQVAQYQVQQLLDSQPQAAIRDEALPLPADRPHCGVYETRYEEIFRDHPSEFAWRLHELLGDQYQHLRSQTEAVDAALTRLQQVSRQRAVQSDGGELLRAYEILRIERQLFVVALHTYNRKIADYTLLVMPGNIEADRLVSMLIYVEPDVKSGGQAVQWKRPEIERTGGYQQLPAQPRQGRPKTFSQTPRKNEASSGSLARPSQSREHSIVVPGKGR